ncbi:lysoplasmalogenase family protein [Pontivivens nitratireducens]|uniref:lysoplasmalogenase family protein n=1 Tax=Pontivivens nitratireducens TaxID=2758038 RepID=UPI00163A692A|nr:lysoplasmalogenase family protein [Pontibrevibacter nitratireducens]
MELLFVIIAIGAGLDYGLFKSWGQPSWSRTLTKTTAILSLIIWAILIDTPNLIVIALGFAAISDFARSRGDLKWMTVSRTAFFSFHALYLIEYAHLIDRPLVEAGPAVILAVFCTIMTIALCWRAFEALWLLALLHSAVLVFQFSVGQLVGGEYILISYTTTLFFLSTLMLGIETFLLEEGTGLRKVSGAAIWFTYLAGQIGTVIVLTEAYST